MLRLLLAFQLAAIIAAAQELDIRFDYSNADATLEALESAPPLDSVLKRLTQVPDTGAVLAKRLRTDKSVTMRMLAETLAAVREGKSPQSDPFQWRFCIQQTPQMRSLLKNLREQEADIRGRVAAVLGRHLAPNTRLSTTVHFVIGGVSAGWEQGAGDFFVGLQFYKGDLDGVVWTMQHELFHNAQFAGYHQQDADIVKLNPRQQEVYRLLDSLYKEGTATFVAGLMSFPADRPYIRDMRQPALVNRDRMQDNFVLLETLIYRLAHDPSVTEQDLSSIGFDWSWQNPLYYAGEYMSQVLVREKGSLKEYLGHSLLQFIRDYGGVCGSTPSEKCRYPLSSGASATVREIDLRLKSQP